MQSSEPTDDPNIPGLPKMKPVVENDGSWGLDPDVDETGKAEVQLSEGAKRSIVATSDIESMFGGVSTGFAAFAEPKADADATSVEALPDNNSASAAHPITVHPTNSLLKSTLKSPARNHLRNSPHRSRPSPERCFSSPQHNSSLRAINAAFSSASTSPSTTGVEDMSPMMGYRASPIFHAER
eukprot:10452911-Ditylum_brightwellii.AAC.1